MVGPFGVKMKCSEVTEDMRVNWVRARETDKTGAGMFTLSIRSIRSIRSHFFVVKIKMVENESGMIINSGVLKINKI